MWGVAEQPPGPLVEFQFKLVDEYPHDREAFCQGLVYHDGHLYEGTGQYGASSLRKVELETGEILKSVDLPPKVFGEGIAIWGDSVIQLTWKNRIALVYDLKNLQLTKRFRVYGQGWGLTHDGKQLILSDGSDLLQFLDPNSFRVVRRLRVTYQGRPLRNLNELEYIDGQVWANVWHENTIVRIDPANGRVTGKLDLTTLVRQVGPLGKEDVLNGIAHHPETGHLFITGKNWPKLYEIELIEPNAPLAE